ncbi:DNA cytosine methyltransferase [Nocardioides sp.]|uniref:DNA cytosine methyltransferase n=1 Tax=Nocardioides sp. TaxID=35761 RepID=UPI00271CCEE2|nr:DNA cytosine methyltransferase [Nocardioides sp.]MDO9455226.1 DNA cytosine methyltransferase [Nocardioides sp.]
MTTAEREQQHPLRAKAKPTVDLLRPRTLKVVDLFAGCGGLSLGAEMAATALRRRLDVRLAVDFEAAATQVYRSNFAAARRVLTKPVEEVLSVWTAPELTDGETRHARRVGRVDVLLGGPPCQGHSNLNNHTRRNDPKNALYLYMVRAARVFAPSAVIIENVPAILHDTFNGSNVVEIARVELKALGYEVHDQVIPLVDLGVAQRRKRHVLLATKKPTDSPATVLEGLIAEPTPVRDLRWAIKDLETASGVGWDTPPKASPANSERMQYLVDSGNHDLPNELRPVCHQGLHSYVSMYGRLKWDEPAQTITSGFGSIGQGRYMHPGQKRALTAHEAARIQGFPDYFRFGEVQKRSDLATMIGNAVPPQLSERIILALHGW